MDVSVNGGELDIYLFQKEAEATETFLMGAEGVYRKGCKFQE